MRIKLTYKQQFFAIIISMIIMAIVVFNIAIKPTIDESNRKKNLNQKYNLIDEATEQSAVVQQNLAVLNNTYFKGALNSFEVSQEYLLNSLNLIAKKHKVKITRYPGEHMFQGKSIALSTHIFTLQGSFHSLLKVLHTFEIEHKSFKIASLTYHTEIDRKTKKRQLFLTMYIQQLTNI